jgi:hypothetical protein
MEERQIVKAQKCSEKIRAPRKRRPENGQKKLRKMKQKKTGKDAVEKAEKDTAEKTEKDMSKSAESNNVERFRTMELKKLKKSNRTN